VSIEAGKPWAALGDRKEAKLKSEVVCEGKTIWPFTFVMNTA